MDYDKRLFDGVPSLGVLGGMGPAATAEFLMNLAAETPAMVDQEHFPTLVYSDPGTADRSNAITGRGPSPLKSLVRGIEFLATVGASAIAIPCNTAHYWYDDIVNAVDIPVLHIVDCVGLRIRKDYPEVRRVGVMSTDGTAAARLYNRLEKFGFEIINECELPGEAYSMRGIREVKGGRFDEGRRLLSRGVQRLVSCGAEGIVYGCTDISAAMGGERSEGGTVPTWDSSVSLAKSSVAHMLSL